MTTDLKSIGLGFDNFQDAVEAAIRTNQLAVIGEVRGGQLVQYSDASGAVINILAVEPFATYAGFDSVTRTYGNVTMVNDVLAYCEVLAPNGAVMTGVALNLAQGPLLADLDTQQWQELGVTALVDSYSLHADAASAGSEPGEISSPGAEIIAASDGSRVPDAHISFTARILDANYRHNQLTGQRFIHATVDGAFAFDVCLPDAAQLPHKDMVLTASGILTGQVTQPVGGGCGCGGSCGCGGH
ncbi:hypothetical protein C3B44_04705 [Corynebacterium yudongzhengii]|uniref:Uncharacterized protein n=1 Tax=Corynebacterium yudongzhengii TaxID=2080740 RepID=A0A2U1T5B9_9CORY|nr:hypothetical protein [Corynebacterium yudongzhengii]AWB81750.1 hypothetical protein C3B44_04705 [Corynebacterium yudongzhengii]PWC01183.1 hypothetical protein DF222_08955 [Corynebacterium yudongzhengii]